MATLRGKSGLVVRAQQFEAGVTKHLANQAQVTFTGGTFTPAQITAKLQSLGALRAAVDAAKASMRARLAEERAETPSLRAFTGALGLYVKAVFGDSPEVLADFGLVPMARASLTVEAKVAASAKRAATRKARATLGPKQKLRNPRRRHRRHPHARHRVREVRTYGMQQNVVAVPASMLTVPLGPPVAAPQVPGEPLREGMYLKDVSVMPKFLQAAPPASSVSAAAPLQVPFEYADT